MNHNTGNQPAFPLAVSEATSEADRGMTYRQWLAGQFAVICAGPGATMVALKDERYDGTNWKEIVAMNAVEFTDALIAELDKDVSKPKTKEKK